MPLSLLTPPDNTKAWDLSETVEIPTDMWKGTQNKDSPWQRMKVPRQNVNVHEATGLPFEVHTSHTFPFLLLFVRRE